ncbi:MAG: hypothetical protein M5R40_06960 [Anaerolineae bacterium]|nr:hypothetical protein [Anaerolineae bacterium]
MRAKLFSHNASRDPRDGVRRLPQTDETWEASWRLGRTWVQAAPAPPRRPYLLFIVSDRDQVVGLDVLDAPPSTDQVWEALLTTMRRPVRGAGRKRRPGAVILDQEALVDALAPRLDAIGVTCRHREDLPHLAAAVRAMEHHLARHTPAPPSLLGIPGVSAALLGNLFTQAAAFYRLAPWKRLPYEAPIKVRFPADAAARYVVVMGAAGETFGLAAYDRLHELHQVLLGAAPGTLDRHMTWFTLTYDSAPYLAFDDLDAIARYDWPVADERAYPAFARVITVPALRPPTRKDLYWLEGALPLLCDFFAHHLEVDAQGKVRPFEYTLTVATLNGPKPAYLGDPSRCARPDRLAVVRDAVMCVRLVASDSDVALRGEHPNVCCCGMKAARRSEHDGRAARSHPVPLHHVRHAEVGASSQIHEASHPVPLEARRIRAACAYVRQARADMILAPHARPAPKPRQA